MSSWPFFKDVDFADESIKQYHIDVRDFHCQTSTESKVLNLQKLDKQAERFVHTPAETLAILTEIFEASGGKIEWRRLYLKFQYFRVYRMTIGKNNGLVICNKENYALRKEILKDEAMVLRAGVVKYPT